MAVKMTRGGRFALFGIILLGAIGAFYWYNKYSRPVGESVLMSSGETAIPDGPDASLPSGDAVKFPFPTDQISGVGAKGTLYDMGWQSGTGINYANGGSQTTKGSVYASLGINLTVERQADCMASQAKVAQFCKDYKDNPSAPFVMATYMGSGIPGALYNVRQLTKDLPEEYQPIGFMNPGASVGEDQVMGDPMYKLDKEKLRGTVCICVKLDGDQDLMTKLATSFNIPINTDPATLDLDAVNFRYVPSYTDAAQKYNINETETRSLVRKGKRLGRDTTIGIQLVATWTPGDVTVNKGPRGSRTVSIISTKEYSAIMPAITITCKKWLNDHRDVAENLIKGSAIAADQIRSFEDIKKFACGLNAKIYKEESAEYWYRYFNGVTIPTLLPNGETDSSNHLGGSRVHNLADMANMLGIMIPGKTDNNDIYGAVYTTFANLQHKLYPDDLKEVVAYDNAFDKTFIYNVINKNPELLKGKALLPNYSATMTNKVGDHAWHLEFATGSAELLPGSEGVIDEIYNEIISTEGAKATLIGHTDNTGNPAANVSLSEARARTVLKKLIAKGIPTDRFFPPEGKGQAQPLADNATEAGRSQNRRVNVALVTK